LYVGAEYGIGLGAATLIITNAGGSASTKRTGGAASCLDADDGSVRLAEATPARPPGDELVAGFGVPGEGDEV
jgi:hypothetical protein